MNFTLSFGDLIAIAAVVALLIRCPGAQASPTPRDLRMQRQLDAIMDHLGLPEPPASRLGALSPEVIALLAAGQRIGALKLYRRETGESLKQAREAVEQHLAAAPGRR